MTNEMLFQYDRIPNEVVDTVNAAPLEALKLSMITKIMMCDKCDDLIKALGAGIIIFRKKMELEEAEKILNNVKDNNNE